MVRYILTHPGGAHKDDLLAVCVLIAKYGAPVVRRDPTPEELQSDEIAVVDIGGHHEPERMNFDHHQFERDHEPICALSLVLSHLGLYEDARRFCDWLEPGGRPFRIPSGGARTSRFRLRARRALAHYT